MTAWERVQVAGKVRDSLEHWVATGDTLALDNAMGLLIDAARDERGG